VWAVTGGGAARHRARLERAGVKVIVPAGARPGRRLHLGRALRALRREGLWSLMVEGGAALLGALLAERLFDQVALFRAPLLLGGAGSVPAFGGPDPRRLARAVRLQAEHPLTGTRARGPGWPDPALCELWHPWPGGGAGRRRG
jgi:diaminohydroxyphosphoribosylaminopyrimidine deaminase/5-amino-6-(5-phosphoribosylamino)uracil reductase